MKLKPLPLALAGLLFVPIAHAVGVATDAQLDTLEVTADRAPVGANLPNTTESKTTEDLAKQNLFNPEDALKYAPNTTIRKRYIGDRNALIGGRSFGTLQPSRGLVYVADYLISNFLGRFDAPRWNMVTPEAMEHVDILYGPYSALFPGNSIGTTVVIRERTPDKLEGSVKLTGYTQHFDQFGDSDRYNGAQLSAYLGAKLKSGLWAALTVNHQDSTSQPMQWFNVEADRAGASVPADPLNPIDPAVGVFPSVPAGATTTVSGIQYDTSPTGHKRAVFGANSGAIDHTVQDTVKLKLGYSFTPQIELTGLIGGWVNDTENSNRTFLRDLAGNPIWSGKVTDGVNTFNIPDSTFAPSRRDEKHLQLGATLKTKYKSGWNGSVVASAYEIIKDDNRVASNPEPVAANGGPGTVTHRDGTGWNTLEIQGLYIPVANDFGNGNHALTFGLHRNAYTLEAVTNNATDWRSTETTLANSSKGATNIEALYAQDRWRLNDAFSLTAGLRLERFKAFDGEQTVRVAGASCVTASNVACVPVDVGFANRVVTLAERKLNGVSPKLSLAWTAADDLLLKASYGRGVRFPNVEELYAATVTATSVTLSDPDLKAEQSDAFELSAEKFWDQHTLRVSLFHDDVSDAILRQTQFGAAPGGGNLTNISNVDRVKTTGIEFSWKAQDLVGVRGLSLDANMAFTDSKVTENAKDPASVDKYWLRVPKTRGSLLLAYRPTAQWMGSVGYRHQGRAYNNVYNYDTNSDVYGGVSKVNQVDLRVSYKPQPKLELALGIDNAFDERAFQVHPFPGRTMFVELKAKL